MTTPENASPGGAAERFRTTRWSVVIAAGQRSSPDSARALAELCEKYWYPVYAFIRRRGNGPTESLDLTQAFFLLLLEKNVVAQADPNRGRFRTFLLAAVTNYLANERDRAQALKRGGGRVPFSLDADAAEQRYSQEADTAAKPETLYFRRWALSLLNGVFDRLRDELATVQGLERFERLKPFLTADHSAGSYREVAEELSMSEGAVKVAVHRLRLRYRELLRAEIAETVSTSDEVDDEIRELFALFE